MNYIKQIASFLPRVFTPVSGFCLLLGLTLFFIVGCAPSKSNSPSRDRRAIRPGSVAERLSGDLSVPRPPLPAQESTENVLEPESRLQQRGGLTDRAPIIDESSPETTLGPTVPPNRVQPNAEMQPEPPNQGSEEFNRSVGPDPGEAELNARAREDLPSDPVVRDLTIEEVVAKFVSEDIFREFSFQITPIGKTGLPNRLFSGSVTPLLLQNWAATSTLAFDITNIQALALPVHQITFSMGVKGASSNHALTWIGANKLVADRELMNSIRLEMMVEGASDTQNQEFNAAEKLVGQIACIDRDTHQCSKATLQLKIKKALVEHLIPGFPANAPIELAIELEDKDVPLPETNAFWRVFRPTNFTYKTADGNESSHALGAGRASDQVARVFKPWVSRPINSVYETIQVAHPLNTPTLPIPLEGAVTPRFERLTLEKVKVRSLVDEFPIAAPDYFSRSIFAPRNILGTFAGNLAEDRTLLTSLLPTSQQFRLFFPTPSANPLRPMLPQNSAFNLLRGAFEVQLNFDFPRVEHVDSQVSEIQAQVRMRFAIDIDDLNRPRATLLDPIALGSPDWTFTCRLQRRTQDEVPHLENVPCLSDAVANPNGIRILNASVDTPRGETATQLRNLSLFIATQREGPDADESAENVYIGVADPGGRAIHRAFELKVKPLLDRLQVRALCKTSLCQNIVLLVSEMDGQQSFRPKAFEFDLSDDRLTSNFDEL